MSGCTVTPAPAVPSDLCTVDARLDLANSAAAKPCISWFVSCSTFKIQKFTPVFSFQWYLTQGTFQKLKKNHWTPYYKERERERVLKGQRFHSSPPPPPPPSLSVSLSCCVGGRAGSYTLHAQQKEWQLYHGEVLKMAIFLQQKGTEICNYSYPNTILAVKLNRNVSSWRFWSNCCCNVFGKNWPGPVSLLLRWDGQRIYHVFCLTWSVLGNSLWNYGGAS